MYGWTAFLPFFIAFGIILQHSLSKDFRALHRYYLITICRGMKCFSQGQSATHGRVCVITVISRLQSHSAHKRLIAFSWGKPGDALVALEGKGSSGCFSCRCWRAHKLPGNPPTDQGATDAAASREGAALSIKLGGGEGGVAIDLGF